MSDHEYKVVLKKQNRPEILIGGGSKKKINECRECGFSTEVFQVAEGVKAFMSI